jgi:hypothetical protein
MTCARRTLGAVAKPLGSASPALLVALLPKCPACIGAYLAILSGLGLDHVDPGVLQGIMIGGLVVALGLLGRAAARRGRWLVFAVACTGAAIVVAGRWLDAERVVLIAGVVLLYAGALGVYLRRRVCVEVACHST